MSKHMASEWFSRAQRLSDLDEPFRSKNIAVCLASAYRQGRDAGGGAMLRMILSEARRTGSWVVPIDVRERLIEMEKAGLL